MLRYVDSQEEFTRYMNDFKGHDSSGWIEYYWNARKTIFLIRHAIYYSLFRWHFRFDHNDFPFT